ncbi:MAG: choice-of-anchor J domain-containing protein [Candidatus Zixiibacteriota bacterium]|nr:MAG: choice-of-anchor J domain-containing protein [candidate division Zixibacteria bacterium]
MKYCKNVLVNLAILAGIVLFGFSMASAEDITLKSAPHDGTIKKPQPQNVILVDFLTEGFETWFPPNWTRIITNGNYTWNQSGYSPHGGAFNAQILYDPALVPQDEWMISPILDLSSASPDLELSFWFLTSYYWHVSPYDNGDMIIVVSTDGGNNWSNPLWTEDDYGVFQNWVWYEVVLDFSAYVGEPNFKVALVYQGVDGAQADFDDVLLSDGAQPFEHDVAAVEVLAPIGTGDVGVPVTPEATFGNMGANTETFTASLIIELNGSPVYDEDTVIVDLAGYGATVDVAFPDFTPAAEAIYDVIAVAELTGDQNHANDSAFATYNTIAVSGFFVDFESGPGGFTMTNDWQHGMPTTGPGGAWSGDNLVGTLINGQYTLGPLLSELISPEVTIGEQATLTFYHWYTTENTFDGGNVKISTNGGASWTLITPAGGYDGVLSTGYQNPIGGEEAFYGSNGFWQQESFDLSPYEYESVMIKFDYGSDNSVITGDGWYIDDFFLEFYITDIEEDAEVPIAFRLEQNYPNPFNASTTIDYTLEDDSHVTLDIFDILGRKIETLVNGNQSSGAHSVVWNADGVATGLYFYRIQAGDFSEIKQMTLLK